MRPSLSHKALVQGLLALTSAVMIVPILFTFLGGFKSNNDLISRPFSLTTPFSLDAFRRVFAETDFPRYLLNSVIVTGGALIVLLVLGTMAAYGLGRYSFRGNDVLYLFFLSGLMLPLKLAVIPLFLQLKALGLVDTHWSLIVIYAAMGLPSTVFILTGFIRTLPGELEESARLDGASEGRIMLSIMLPLVRPALVIAGIYNVVPVWNDFFFPLIFIQENSLKTLPQGLTMFMGEYSTDWSVLFAGLSLSFLPIAIAYLLLSKQFIAGLTAGAVK
ncbi:MAG TPA: carbohydrate ABC transporter permease [Deinococcales bacterium]|nr:carbohydrate ABC transporter permease [Deinococcales bacterium]